MTRERLPNRRGSETFSFMNYNATISRFADGRLGEIFLSSHKSGSDTDTNARDAAIVCSIALQHGVAVETIRKALMRDGRGVASGPLGLALDQIAGGTP